MSPYLEHTPLCPIPTLRAHHAQVNSCGPARARLSTSRPRNMGKKKDKLKATKTKNKKLFKLRDAAIEGNWKDIHFALKYAFRLLAALRRLYLPSC